MRLCPSLPLPDESATMLLHKAHIQRLTLNVSTWLMSGDSAPHLPEVVICSLLEKLPGILLPGLYYKLICVVIHCKIASSGSNDTTQMIVRKILDGCPGVAKRCDKKLMLPLHILLADELCDRAAVLSLLQLHPAALYALNEYGDTPLHTYLRHPHPDHIIIRHLLNAYPQGAKIKTALGKFPLHLAMKHVSSEHLNDNLHLTIKELLKVFPEAALEPTTDEIHSFNLFTNENVATVLTWTPMEKAHEMKQHELVASMVGTLSGKATKKLSSLMRPLAI